MESLLLFLLVGACIWMMLRMHKGHAEGTGHMLAPGVDPVCGMQVEADQGYAHCHQGRLYRFCSRRCLERFDTEPDRYAQATTDMADAPPGGSS